MVKVKRKTRSTSSAAKSKGESLCCECNSAHGDGVKALQCERCGDTEGTWKCKNCLSVSDEFYDELLNLPVNNSFHWFCSKCEKIVQKSSDLRIESVLQMLSQAMDKINSLENTIRSSLTTATEFENKVMTRIESTENKIQLLLDVTIPPTLNDSTFVETQTDEHQDNKQNSDGIAEAPAASTIVPPPVLRTGWSELFHRVSEVAAEVRAVKEATAVNVNQQQPKSDQSKQQQKPDDDNIARSVVVYGLPDSRATNDTLVIDHLIKQLDNSLSVDSHRRLRKKATTESSASAKPPPLLVVMSTEFDRRKLLSLASNLKQLDQYKSVFIKKALSVSEYHETTELRRMCATANEILSKTDPELVTKYTLIDGKIRRLVRITDTSNYKVEWSAVINQSDLPKN